MGPSAILDITRAMVGACLTLSLTACASVCEPDLLDRVKMGMSKAEVIAILGTPRQPCPDLEFLGEYYCAGWLIDNPLGGLPEMRTFTFDPDDRLFDITGPGNAPANDD